MLFWKKKKGSIFNIGRKKGNYDLSNHLNVEQVINIECNIWLPDQLYYYIGQNYIGNYQNLLYRTVFPYNFDR